MNTILFDFAIIGAASFAALWTAWRLKIPSIVFLLVIGFILGPVMHVLQVEGYVGWSLQPDEFMGELLRPAVALAVAIILFEGSLNLRLREIKEIQPEILRIVLIGAPLCWVLTSSAAHYIAGLSWEVSITFGAILIVTGPTVIMPMLRSSRVKQRVGSILKWEGIINDPIGVILAVLSYEYFKLTQYQGVGTLGMAFYAELSLIIVAIVSLSWAFALLTALIIERGWVPEYLKTIFLFMSVIVIYAACDVLLHESGLIAVTVFGMVLANKELSSIEEIRRFKETVTLMLVSGVFILLTARLDPEIIMQVDLLGLAFVCSVMFLIRPAVVFVSSLGSNLEFKEKILVSMTAPRGIVCAAISGVMGLLLVEAGIDDGEKMLPLAFAIVFSTVLFNGLCFSPMAKALGLQSEESNGVLIVGARDWTIQLAQALKERGVPVLLVDRDWHKLKAARLSNVPVYYGEVLSEEAEFNVELDSYNTVLALTNNESYNSLICGAFAPEIGRERVIQLAGDQQVDEEYKRVADLHLGKSFVSEGISYFEWVRRFSNGWRFKTTRTSEEASEQELTGLHENSIKVGVISKAGRVTFSTPDFDPTTKPGDLLLLFEKQSSDRFEA